MRIPTLLERGMRIQTPQKIRLMWGMTWKGSSMPINWRLAIDGLIFVVLLLLVYALVDYIAGNAELSDRAAKAEHQRVQAESVLVACLNGKPLLSGQTAIFCDTKEVKL